MATSSSSSGQSPEAGKVESSSPHLFARQATGLVREVSSPSALILNHINGSPIIAMSFGLFFALSVYPGGSFYLACLLIIPIMLSYLYSFGFLTAAIPRSGGDYMLVSRIIHPLVGLISSFCMTLAGLLSNVFFGIAFATLAVGPGLIVIGLVGGNETLVSWGSTVLTDKEWQFALATLCIVLGAAIQVGGWRVTLRIQNVLFVVTSAGLLFCLGVAIFTSPEEFQRSWNKFAGPITDSPDSYGAIIATATKAGTDTNAAFSWANTIPLVAVLAGFTIYAYWSTNVGGELRQAKTIKTANNMVRAGFINLACVAIFAWIFLHSFGKPFMTAIYGGGLPEQISAPASYFFLTSAQLGSPLIAVVLAVTFALYWPLITYISYLQPTRMLFAYAFDGILPVSVTKVTKKGAPWMAILITTVLSLITLIWGVYVANNLFQILVYTALIQIVSMGLVGLAAALFPKLRPELFRASTAAYRILGVPAVVIAGVGAVLSTVLLWYLYFHYTALGLAGKTTFFMWFGATILLAVLYYIGAVAVRKRQGVDLKLVYAEIPPE